MRAYWQFKCITAAPIDLETTLNAHGSDAWDVVTCHLVPGDEKRRRQDAPDSVYAVVLRRLVEVDDGVVPHQPPTKDLDVTDENVGIACACGCPETIDMPFEVAAVSVEGRKWFKAGHGPNAERFPDEFYYIDG